MKRRLFIVFEGIDGSGKSTQCDLLFGHVVSIGLTAVRLAEPTDGVWGRRIRNMLKENEMAPAEEQLRLFLLDRKDDAEKNIIPALNGDAIVIMDRYYYSNAAYQGAAGILPERIIAENRKMRFPEPDRVYFIDVPPEVAIWRVSGRMSKGKEVFEKESFLRKVREIFLSLADERFIVIDGTRDIGEIFEIIKRDFEKL
ncbi:MAG: dTMP kinase [Spirochaetes bacterium RBG_13_51_14]|nr:MAG: dTMP kinase [Spirochaetes bacterium RBG_13_51_14]